MQGNLSFLMTCDNTEQCKIQYVSETVTELIGFQPEEIIGQPVYAFLDPNEVDSLRPIHLSNVMNEKLCSMISYRYLHKDGNFVKMQSVCHYCCDNLVIVNWLYDVDSIGHKQRMNSVDEAFEITDTGELQLASMGSFPWRPNDMRESMKNSLMVSKHWHKEQVQHEQEPRFHIILNRYSERLNIVHVSQMVSDILGIFPADLLGKSLFDVVYYMDRPVVEAQCLSAKSHFVMARIRFDWVVDSERDIRQSVDSVVTGFTDGLVMVLRLTKKPVQLS